MLEPLEETFKKAGQQHGLQIWRIVELKLQEIPESDHGQLFTGDSYRVGSKGQLYREG